MYSTSWCGDCRRSKAWMDAHNVEYREVNIEEDEGAMAYVQKVNNGFKSVPTIVFPDGSVLVEPSNTELEEKIKTLKLT